MGTVVVYKDLVAFHPGYYLKEIMDERNLTSIALAKKLSVRGVSRYSIDQIINGNKSLTPTIIKALVDFAGVSEQTWQNLQNAYDEKIIEIENATKEDSLKWLKNNKSIHSTRLTD